MTEEDKMATAFGFTTTELATPTPTPIAAEPAAVIEPQATIPTAEPKAIEPTAPITTPEFDWRKNLVEATNGLVNNEDELKTFISSKTTAEQKAADLEAKFNSLPPMVKKELEMREKGATNVEIDNFRKLQSLDIDTMNSIERLKQYHKLNEPTAFLVNGKFDDSLLESFVSETYVKDVEDMTSLEKVELNRKVTAATNYLKDQIVNSENVESAKVQQQREVEKQTYYTNLQSTMSDLVRQGFAEKSNINVEGLDSIEGGKLSVDYTLNAQDRQEIVSLTLNQAASLGIDPRNTAAIKDLADKFTFALKGKEMIDLAVKSAIAKTKQATIKELSGDKAQPTNTAIPTQAQGSWMDAFSQGNQ